MVAAGVYLLGRVFFLFALPSHLPEALAWLDISALDVVAWTGAVTALLAALMALQQDDFKRILAYSTLSQLGYMVLAAGLSGAAHSPAPALFHLITHAFFKALLFLGAGSVIVALHHEQNIWKMGGLWRQMPITTATFLAGALALCGMPPFSGFFSKDEILALAYAQSPILFGIGVVVALLTAFYMTRLILVAFFGPNRLTPPSPVRESSPVLTVPLLVLAVPALLAGFWGILPYLELAGKTGLDPRHTAVIVTAPVARTFVPMLASLMAAGAGFGLAWRGYRRARQDPLPQWGGGLVRAIRNRFYLDDFYQNTAVWAHDALGAVIAACDQWIVSGLLIRGLHGSVELLGRLLRLTQTGQVQTQAFLTLLGVLLVLYWALR